VTLIREATARAATPRFGESARSLYHAVSHSAQFCCLNMGRCFLPLACANIENTDFMESWPTIRRSVTLLILLLAATEILACQLVSPDTCIYSNHSTHDSDQDCSGDGCLCCCTHIVVVAPIGPLARLGFISRAVPVDNVQTPDFPPSGIEHPPRF
jgi:hypothetical protein